MTPLTDTHVHVWDPARLHYPWLGDAAAPRLPADLPSGADRLVFVQADCLDGEGLDEARWVAGLDWPAPTSIVAFAPVERGDAVQPWLDELGDVPGVVGIRRLLQADPDDLISSPLLLAGLERVARGGLAFDLGVVWHQVALVAAAFRDVAGLRLVLDHLGKPPLRSGIDSDEGRAWLRGLEALLALDDVTVKLSGLAAESDRSRPLGPQAAPFLRAAADLAGADRLILGSDWPVSPQTSDDYTDWFWIVRDAIGVDDATWQRIATANAARVYPAAPGDDL
ncbi:amidohydrolase family protein [Frondihabitans australicus]|uniref:L-fuconolactonase n=1 Tax=Frondihabitans australicus TaxID=386892 RepID=A0A495IGH7_9MICO|nr:amidohydrolase family protein [Frondihabitans australicus]RKR75054.1 L-fuconolactonase [Frondihabitans australicus]